MINEVELVHKTTPDVEIRVCRRAEVGKTVIHQGDVYFHCVADTHPRGKALGTRQVAVGTTVGARHVVEGKQVSVFEGRKLPAGVTVPSWCTQDALLGPLVVSETNFTLTHPEHAHHVLPPGTYQVTYQADYSTRQRVAD